MMLSLGAGDDVERVSMNLGFVFDIALYGAPAIGGFVAVGQMLRSYGTCIRFL